MLETSIFQLCHICRGVGTRSGFFKGARSSLHFLFLWQFSHQTRLQSSSPRESELLYEDERVLIRKGELRGRLWNSHPGVITLTRAPWRHTLRREAAGGDCFTSDTELYLNEAEVVYTQPAPGMSDLLPGTLHNDLQQNVALAFGSLSSALLACIISQEKLIQMLVGMRDWLGTPSPHLHLTGICRTSLQCVSPQKPSDWWRCIPGQTAQKGGRQDTIK